MFAFEAVRCVKLGRELGRRLLGGAAEFGRLSQCGMKMFYKDAGKHRRTLVRMTLAHQKSNPGKLRVVSQGLREFAPIRQLAPFKE